MTTTTGREHAASRQRSFPGSALWRRVSGSLLMQTAREFRADRPMELSAAVSYYTLLSLAPIVLVTVAVTGLVFGREAVEGRVVVEMRGLVGESGAEVIQTVLENARNPVASTWSLILGLAMLLVGATTVFIQLQDALNRIWDVVPKPNANAFRSFVKDRLLSVAMVFGIGFLLMVSLVVSAAVSALGDWAGGPFDTSPVALQVVNVLGSLAVIALLFAMIFKFLPDVHVAWREVWFGALATSVLFTAGKYVIGLYLGRASVGSAYGAAGSVVVVMVWVYYASLIVFFGAELTHVHAQRARGRIAPKRYAEKVAPAKDPKDRAPGERAPNT
jgi:membrane protein